MGDTTVPPPPPADPGGGWRAPAWQPALPPKRPRTGRTVLLVALGVLVVLGGCTALLYAGGSRLVGAARAPVDAANEFLDAARVGGPAPTGRACPGPLSGTPERLTGAEGQHLSQVNIVDNRATVSGTITWQGGQESPVTVGLRSIDGDWCVESVSVRTPPD